MPASTDTKDRSGQKTGIYVYCIVPGDVELTEEIRGVGNSEVKLVRSDDLAALVSEVDTSKPLGTPEDFQAHEEIVDSTATGAPVLPLRFGAVLTDEEAVTSELLDAHSDEFSQSLSELEGRVQYVIRGRYGEEAILKEILSENSEAAELREEIRDADPDATRNERIRLGEIINTAIAVKREEDTRQLLSRIGDRCEASSLREPTHELDAVYVACLVDADKADELDQAVDDLNDDWQGRVELRVLGPMAPWDFVDASQQAQG